jgi:hypothetical protein
MTLNVLLILMFGFTIGATTFVYVGHAFSIWVGIPAGIVAGFFAVFGLCKILDYIYLAPNGIVRRKMREKYARIYRILDLPAGEKNTMVKIGDYGWEAKPFLRRSTDRKGNLIYLKGWNENWNLIWYSGFLPNEIECIGQKPFSEYDLPNPPKPRPLCPFPVQPREKTTD